MKKSLTPTNKVLVRAGNEDEYVETGCNFAIVEITDGLKKIVGKAKELIAEVTDYSFCKMNFFTGAAEFLYDEEEEFGNLLDDKDWCFVELDDENELDNYEIEDRLELQQLNVYNEGDVCFTATTKYTGVEFYTYTIKFPLEG